MTLSELRTFLAIVETGSLVRASRVLNVTQSTVTARLKSLEAELGQTLIRQGETSDDIYFLREGVLAVEIADTLGGRMRVGVHSAGTLVGEMALYTDGRRSADVVAVSGCELLRLSGADLARMEEEAPAEALRFHRAAARQIAMRLRRTNALVGMLKA